MCGLTGFAGFRDDENLRRITGLLRHRGPDDEGYFVSDQISLGHRRLKIIDLEHGAQPMCAEQNRVALAFNGEIYNYQELKADLEHHGHIFQTASDTEVLLKAYLQWGMDLLPRLNGMFAFAIADLRKEPVLFLVRDRLGIKPLYYSCRAGKIAFASEIKALLPLDFVSKTIRPTAIDQYLRYRYVPGPETLFRDIHMLPPATVIKFTGGQLNKTTWWALPEDSIDSSASQIHDTFEELLESSVRYRMVADVPVGAYLSGGLDSAVIAALMQRHGSGTLNTFTVGFGHEKDELDDARRCAAILGANHHELICGVKDFDLMEKVVYHLDQPIGDAIILPMYLLAKEASRHVKVVLCGEGADELFGGYLFHKVIHLMCSYKRLSPKALRRLAQLIVRLTPHQFLNLFFQYPAALGHEGKNKLLHFMDMLEKASVSEMFRYLITLFDDHALTGLYTAEFKDQRRQDMVRSLSDDQGDSSLEPLLRLQYDDWLPDLMLTKQDKLTMAHSIEGRFLYMDHRLAEFAAKLPARYKIKGWQDKRILRHLGRRLGLPAARKIKKPFFIPMEDIKGVETSFEKLTFLDRDRIRIGSGEFMKRRQEVSLWILSLFFQAHGIDAAF